MKKKIIALLLVCMVCTMFFGISALAGSNYGSCPRGGIHYDQVTTSHVEQMYIGYHFHQTYETDPRTLNTVEGRKVLCQVYGSFNVPEVHCVKCNAYLANGTPSYRGSAYDRHDY